MHNAYPSQTPRNTLASTSNTLKLWEPFVLMLETLVNRHEFELTFVIQEVAYVTKLPL